MKHSSFCAAFVLIGLVFAVQGCGGTEGASAPSTSDASDATDDGFTPTDTASRDTGSPSDTRVDDTNAGDTIATDTTPPPKDTGSDTTPPTDGGGSCVDQCAAAYPDGFSSARLNLYECYCEAATGGCVDVCGLSTLCSSTSPVSGSDFCGRCVADHKSATTGPCAPDMTRCKADAACSAYLDCLDAKCPH